MADLTNYAEKKIGDHTLGLSSWTMPAVCLSLHTADPGEAGSHATEVTGTTSGYARQDASSAWGATDATSGIAANDDIIEFGPAAGANATWGVISHVGFEDSDVEGAGNMLIFKELSTPELKQLGDVFRVDIGDLSVQFG